MKEIPLSSKKYPGLKVLVDDEDYDKISSRKWFPVKSSKNFYAARGRKKRFTQYMHRLILFGDGEHLIPAQVDHIDGNSLNNQKNNLRKATGSQNKQNRGKSRTNTSGVVGIQQIANKKWLARIEIDGKKIFLGYFHFKENAALARGLSELQHFREFRRKEP